MTLLDRPYRRLVDDLPAALRRLHRPRRAVRRLRARARRALARPAGPALRRRSRAPRPPIHREAPRIGTADRPAARGRERTLRAHGTPRIAAACALQIAQRVDRGAVDRAPRSGRAGRSELPGVAASRRSPGPAPRSVPSPAATPSCARTPWRRRRRGRRRRGSRSRPASRRDHGAAADATTGVPDGTAMSMPSCMRPQRQPKPLVTAPLRARSAARGDARAGRAAGRVRAADPRRERCALRAAGPRPPRVSSRSSSRMPARVDFLARAGRGERVAAGHQPVPDASLLRGTGGDHPRGRTLRARRAPRRGARLRISAFARPTRVAMRSSWLPMCLRNSTLSSRSVKLVATRSTKESVSGVVRQVDLAHARLESRTARPRARRRSSSRRLGLSRQQLGQPVELGLRARELGLERVEPSLLQRRRRPRAARIRGRGRRSRSSACPTCCSARDDLVARSSSIRHRPALLRAGVPAAKPRPGAARRDRSSQGSACRRIRMRTGSLAAGRPSLVLPKSAARISGADPSGLVRGPTSGWRTAVPV